MKFLKKLTLLMSILGVTAIGISQNAVLVSKEIDQQMINVITRASKTNVLDLSDVTLHWLTDDEFKTLMIGVMGAVVDPDNEKSKLPSQEKDSLENPDKRPIQVIINKMKTGFDSDERKQLRYRDEIVDKIGKNKHVSIIETESVYGKKGEEIKGESIRREQIIKTIEVAYDTGYIDFSKTMEIINAKPSKNGIKTILYSKLYELGINKKNSGVSDYLPITIIVSKESDLEEGSETYKIKKWLDEKCEGVFEFTTKKDVKDKYLKSYYEYMKERDVVDLTAIDIDSLSENELNELLKKINSVLNSGTHLIYYGSMYTYGCLHNEESKEFFSNLEDIREGNGIDYSVLGHSNEISLENKYEIMKQINFLNKTGSIVSDYVSYSLVSKICKRAFDHVKKNGKKEKLKFKIFANFEGGDGKKIKKILEKDKNLKVEFGKYDKNVYAKLQEGLVLASVTNTIDLKDVNLTKYKKDKNLDLMMACIEHFLADNMFKNKIEIEFSISKKNKKSDEKIIKEIRKNLEDKYKNVEIKDSGQ